MTNRMGRSETGSGGSRTAPVPLRILAVWPPASYRKLDEALAQMLQAETVLLESGDPHLPGRRLRGAGLFHLLLISPSDFARLSSPNQQRFASRVNLVLFAPDQTSEKQVQELSPLAPASIAMVEDILLDVVVFFVQQLCSGLVAGHDLPEAVREAQHGAHLPTTAIHFHSGQPEGAIWPVVRPKPPRVEAQESISTPEPALPPVPLPSCDPAVHINTAIMGDVHTHEHQHDHFESDGDQINIIRQQSAGASRTFRAGQGQVNLIRDKHGAPTGSNREAAVRCSACLRYNDPNENYCAYCGAELGQSNCQSD